MLGNFTYYNPTKLYFGGGSVASLRDELPKYGPNIVLVYGGGSIKTNGIYDQVTAILKDCGKNVAEISGVMPNPTLPKVLEGVEICRRHQADFLLAVGGGRPLSSSMDALRQMEAQRRPLYLAAADAVIPNNGTLDDALHAAMEALDEIFDS